MFGASVIVIDVDSISTPKSMFVETQSTSGRHCKEPVINVVTLV